MKNGIIKKKSKSSIAGAANAQEVASSLRSLLGAGYVFTFLFAMEELVNTLISCPLLRRLGKVGGTARYQASNLQMTVVNPGSY